jgi:hypothetical protein
MLTELAVLGGLVGFMVAVLEVSYRLDAGATDPLSPEAAVREGMRGRDGDAAALRAEFRRRGVQPVDRPRPFDFGF